MPGYTRQQLKHDRFTDATQETVSWAMDHRTRVIAIVAVALVIAGAVGGGWLYFDHQDEQASIALGQAVRVYDRPLRPAGTPPVPDFPSFASSAERGREAQKQFLALADKYPHTRSAEIARYLAGVAAVDAGDAATAERELKAAADSRHEDMASLAKMALASLYRTTKRDADALTIYNQLVDHPTTAVSKTTALLAKAELLDATAPAEAKRVYQQIRAEDPSGPFGRLAEQRINNPGK